jgi:hypothetical protein
MTNKQLITCECGQHFIEVQKISENSEELLLSVDFFYGAFYYSTSFLERLKAAYKILTKGQYLFYDLIIDRTQSEKLKNTLENFLKEDSIKIYVRNSS